MAAQSYKIVLDWHLANLDYPETHIIVLLGLSWP